MSSIRQTSTSITIINIFATFINQSIRGGSGARVRGYAAYLIDLNENWNSASTANKIDWVMAPSRPSPSIYTQSIITRSPTVAGMAASARKCRFRRRWSHATLTLKVFWSQFGHEIWQNKLEWIGYIPAKFRDSSSRISWFSHRRFLPPIRPPTRW